MLSQHIFLPILLIAVSSNLDNIGVGTSYGVRNINIPVRCNLLIAVITAGGTFLAMLLGKSVYSFIDERTANMIGGGTIAIAGLWVILQEKVLHGAVEHMRVEPRNMHEPSRYSLTHILKILDNPVAADWDFSGSIDIKEAGALALGLTINNIPNGVGAGMSGLDVFAMTSVVFLTSIVTIWFGIYLGQIGWRSVGKSAGVLAGILLIGIGIYEAIA